MKHMFEETTVHAELLTRLLCGDRVGAAESSGVRVQTECKCTTALWRIAKHTHRIAWPRTPLLLDH
jgi:hypothetical protein